MRVGRLARLGDADDERVGVEHRLAVAELAGHVDLHRHARQLLDGVGRDEAGVVRGAAGDDEDAPQAAQELVAHPRLREVDGAVLAQAPGERVAQGGRLLVDLLQHEGLVAALLGRVLVAGELPLLADDRAARRRRGTARLGAQGHDVAVLEHHHAPRVREEGGDGRGEEHLALADPDHERRLVARADDDVGLVGRDGAERVVAVQFGERAAHGRREVGGVVLAPPVQVLLDEVRHDLGVGLAGERVAALGEAGAQLLVVLDDAVEDDADAAAAVVVRVGVLLARAPVRGPARVTQGRGGGRAVRRRPPRTARRGCRRRGRSRSSPPPSSTSPAES